MSFINKKIADYLDEVYRIYMTDDSRKRVLSTGFDSYDGNSLSFFNEELKEHFRSIGESNVLRFDRLNSKNKLARDRKWEEYNGETFARAAVLGKGLESLCGFKKFAFIEDLFCVECETHSGPTCSLYVPKDKIDKMRPEFDYLLAK